MPTITTGQMDFELIDGSGNVLGLMLVKEGEQGAGAPVTLDEMIAAASMDAQISKQLVPSIHVNTGRGVGVDYNSAEGVYSRTPGFYCPAGAVSSSQGPPTGVGYTTTPIVAIMDFGGDVWFAQRGASATYGGRIMRSVGGSASLTTTNFTATGLGYLPAGEYIRDLVVAYDGAGDAGLYASSSDVNGRNGRLHKWNAGTSSWDSTAAALFGTNGRNRMVKVNWQTADGSVGSRVVTIARRDSISYTLPDADPMLAASWVEDVIIGTAETLLELASSRNHVWITAKDGLFDLDGLGQAPNLTSYLANEQQTGTGDAAMYHNNYVLMSTGRGIDRIFVGDNGTLQERPGQCAPGWGTPAENRYRGYATAFCTDQGYVVAALHEPTQKVSSIWWGLDQPSEGSRNPMTWYGPEFFTSVDYRITRIKTSGAAGDLRLWIALQSVAGSAPIVLYQSLPIAGSPIQDLLVAGAMKFSTGNGPSGFFQPYSRLSLLPETFGDEISTKVLDRNGVGTRGLSVNATTLADDGNGTKLTVYSRADPEPSSTAWGTGVDVTQWPSQTVLPAAATSGHRLETRVDFLSPQGGASTPKIGVLTALRREVWRAAPTFSVIRPTVEYGGGVPDLHGTFDERDPDTVTATLLAMAASGRVTLRDRQDKRWTVHVEQVAARKHAYHGVGPHGKSVTTQLEITIVGAA